MRKSKTVIAVLVVAAFLTIWFERERNRQLVQEIEMIRQEKVRLESVVAASVLQQTQTQNVSEATQTQVAEAELLRLRGSAARAVQAEAETRDLRRELAQLKASGLVSANNIQTQDTLTAYLGTPVQTPANLDPRYTKDGLAAAIQLAAQKAGISLRKVVVDDSEYPFLTGVATEPGDWEKLTAQLKTLDGYEFHGSVGDDTSHTLCTVPAPSYPPDTSQPIQRRMGSRLELFYKTFTSQGN